MLLADQTRGVLTGDLLGALAVAAAVCVRRPLLRLGLIILLGGLGFVWDNAAILAFAPALFASVASTRTVIWRQRSRAALVVLGAAALPVAVLLFNHFWYAARPEYVVSPPVDSSPHLSVIWSHITHPEPLFGFYAPELLRFGGWVALLWLLALCVWAFAVALRHRRVEPAVAAAVFAVVLLGVLSVQDTQWNFSPDLYLNGARFLLTMPIGAWVVAHYTLAALRDSGSLDGGWKGYLRPATLTGGIAAVALASAITAQAGFGSQLKGIIAAGTYSNSGVQIQSPAELLTSCAQLAPVYRKARAQILISLDQPFAYGCAAQSGLNTLFPPYDRRPWLVNAAFTRRVERILLWGGINCQQPRLKPGTGRCVPLAYGAELLITPPRTVAQTLARGGTTIYRPPPS
jgi:hypothetical protein